MNLKNLFSYYRFILEIENVLSLQIKEQFIDSTINHIANINALYTNSRQKGTNFKFEGSDKPDKILTPLLNFSYFETTTKFIEKTESFKKQNYKKKITQKQNKEIISEEPKFIYGETLYQYALVINLFNERPNTKSIIFRPMFVILFPSVTKEFQKLSPEVIIENVKRFVGQNYDEQMLQPLPLASPVILLNPSILNPFTSFNLQYESKEVKDYGEASNFVASYCEKFGLNDNQNIKYDTYCCAFNQNMTQGLIKTYDSIELEGPNDLLKTYFSVHKNKQSQSHLNEIDDKSILTTFDEMQAMLNHYGSFERKNLLAPTQRLALIAYISKNKAMTPVNGAPGTGKTSLLRAIAADYIVKSVLEAYKKYQELKTIKFMPPIVCSSTNNEALYNISDGFIEGFEDNIKSSNCDSLYNRWIKYVSSNDENNNIDGEDNCADENEDDNEEYDRAINVDSFDYSKTLLAPVVKTYKGKGKIFETTKSNMAMVMQKIAEQTAYYLKEYQKRFNIPLAGSDYEKLKTCAEHLQLKIQKNIDEIKNVVGYEELYKNIEKLENVEVEIVSKYITNGVRPEEIRKTLYSIRHKRTEIGAKMPEIKRIINENVKLWNCLKATEGLIKQSDNDMSALLDKRDTLTTTLQVLCDFNEFLLSNDDLDLIAKQQSCKKLISVVKDECEKIIKRISSIEQLELEINEINRAIEVKNSNSTKLNSEKTDVDFEINQLKEFCDYSAHKNYDEFFELTKNDLVASKTLEIRRQTVQKIDEYRKSQGFLRTLFLKNEINKACEEIESIAKDDINNLSTKKDILDASSLEATKAVKDIVVEKISSLYKIIDNKNELIEKLKNEIKSDELKLKQTMTLSNDLIGNNSSFLQQINSSINQKIGEFQASLKNNEIAIDKLQQDKTQYEKELDDVNVRLIASEDEKNLCLQFFSIKSFDLPDVEKILSFSRDYDAFEEFSKLKNSYDTTLRVENFYLSIHLLEALFFMKNQIDSVSDEKSVKCPYCESGYFYRTAESRMRRCGNKDCAYEFNDKNPLHEQILKDLSDKEIDFIIKNGYAKINNKYYSCNQNSSGYKKFLNIVQSDKPKPNDSLLEDILPIYPVLSTTCNSFGSVFGKNLTDGKYIVPKNQFEFLLIDEAATILPHKMCIMQSSKRAMTFGDVLQLKPVFQYDSLAEENLLKLFTQDKLEIKEITEYFSCASKIENENEGDKELKNKNTIANNAMSVANNCDYFFLPYNASQLDGDIWLKEHYRCCSRIAAIANELTYKGEMELYVKSEGELIFLNVGGQKSENNTNKEEARAIIDYLLQNRALFETKFREEYKKDDWSFEYNIGIITPFTNQEHLLSSMLKEKGFEHIKAGTVHKFQGSARDIIIFSTVYNSDNKNSKNFFFNRGETDMINVAVTRAKQVLIVVGNKNVLSDGNTHSSLLMKHIAK